MKDSIVFSVGDRVRVTGRVDTPVVLYPAGVTGTVAWVRRYNDMIEERPDGDVHIGVRIDPECEAQCVYEPDEEGCAWFGAHVDASLDAIELVA